MSRIRWTQPPATATPHNPASREKLNFAPASHHPVFPRASVRRSRVTSHKSQVTAFRFATHLKTGFAATRSKHTLGLFPVRNTCRLDEGRHPACPDAGREGESRPRDLSFSPSPSPPRATNGSRKAGIRQGSSLCLPTRDVAGFRGFPAPASSASSTTTPTPSIASPVSNSSAPRRHPRCLLWGSLRGGGWDALAYVINSQGHLGWAIRCRVLPFAAWHSIGRAILLHISVRGTD